MKPIMSDINSLFLRFYRGKQSSHTGLSSDGKRNKYTTWVTVEKHVIIWALHDLHTSAK